MHEIVFTDYYDGKQFKTLTVKTSDGITFGPERSRDGGEERFVVREWSTDKVVCTCKMPARSCYVVWVNGWLVRVVGGLNGVN